MTWSIVARDPKTKQFGVAVATKNFAVGCRVPNIASGVGAVATQALSNPFYGVDGLRLLHEGKPAAEVVKTLVAGDDGREALREILRHSREWLAPGGTVVMELAPHQADALVEEALDLGYDEAFVRHDMSGRARVLVARSG